jgi:catechol 2,3-dioxygenase-like lactoylglutathione lyase family enzyme
MIPVRRIAHATFVTPDIDRQVDYYTEVIGLQVVGRDKDQAVLATRQGEEAVVFRRGSEGRCIGLGFQVSPDYDLADAGKHLQGIGSKSETASDVTPAIGKVLRFEDPYGTKIELFRETRFDHPWQGVTGIAPLKIGHVAWVSEDCKKLTSFFVDNLGFRVSDWMADFFSFLRCGPDHHTVNFVTHEGAPHMHHLAFELKDWAHIQHACEVLGRHKRPIIWGPGRHGIGHNIFIYHRDPDDNIFECYTELDQMKDEVLGYFDPRPWHEDRPQRPKVWTPEAGALVWGTPPTPDFIRGGTREGQHRQGAVI